MPIYAYKAKLGPGKTMEGELFASSRAAALEQIASQGMVPVSVSEKGEAGNAGPGIRLKRRVRSRDVTIFTRQLSSLTKSGVPILSALSTTASQTDNPAFRKVVEMMETDIREGGMLSDAMARFPEMFSGVYVNMVRAGESAGKLDIILQRLADAREKEDEVRRRVQSAMAYPALVISVGVLTVFLLLTFFMPRVISLFRNFEDLPWPTKALMAVSKVFSGYWFWMVLVVLVLGFFYRRMQSTEKGRFTIDGAKLKMPLFGGFIMRHQMAVFSRTLSLLIQAGINIDRAMRLSAGALSNAVIRKQLQNAADETVNQGTPFSAALQKVSSVPPMVINMSAVGEKGGRLDEALAEVAGFYEAEIDQQTRVVMSLIEPVLILVVGGIVGFIVAAMLLPIFKLSISL
jgi:type II secretory pathway component PulF